MYIFLTVNKFQNIQFCHAIDRKTILPDTTDIIYPRDTSGKWKKKKANRIEIYREHFQHWSFHSSCTTGQ